MTSPGWVVAIGVFRRGAVVVYVVAYREDGSRDVVEQRGRLLIVDALARGDVARADEDCGRARRRRDGGGALLTFDGRGDRGGSRCPRGNDAARIHPGHTRVARRPGRHALPHGGAARIPGDRRQVDVRADLEARGRGRYVHRRDRRGRRGVVAGAPPPTRAQLPLAPDELPGLITAPPFPPVDTAGGPGSGVHVPPPGARERLRIAP